MATRAATFAAKVRNLHDYQLRLLNSSVSPPSGHDVANTLKYFSQMLLGILKDVPDFPLVMIYNKERDSKRMALFPSLDYRGLYTVLIQLLEVIPLIQTGVDVLGQALISTILCVMPFIEQDLIDNLPSLVASSIVHLPTSLHGYIVQVLCCFLLPLTMGTPPTDGVFNVIEPSIPGIIMAVLQYTSNTAYHCQLMETLMSLKPDVAKDLLCVIAHGTLKARVPGAHLLFYYWPSLNPTLYDRRGVNTKFNGFALNGWKPVLCQREECLSSGEAAESIKLCLDHRVAVSQQGNNENGPLLVVCAGCADEIKRIDPPANLTANGNQQQPVEPLVELLLPMLQVAATCDNTSCRSSDKTASVSCFSASCTSYNNKRPIRYCAQCHSIRHNNRRGGDHVYHCNLTSAWEMSPEMQSYTVEAIVSLLKEAQPYSFERSSESNDRLTRAGLWLCGDLDTIYSFGLEERRLLSRYGVWLLTAVCRPVPQAAKSIIGRLIGALFHWFDTTAHVTDDQAGSVLEPLKSEMLREWIVEAQENQLDVLLDCLMPWPASYSRIGGSWDTGHCPKAVHIKEGFNRLFCLVPYEIITVDLWNDIVPRWLESMVSTVPSDEWIEFRIILSKLLDSSMSPLGFDAQQMFRFLAVRFRGTHLRVQQQTLNWLQLLSSLHIVVPIDLLVNIFQEGVNTSKLDDNDMPNLDTEEIRPLSPVSNQSVPSSDLPLSLPEKSLACHVLMLDILLEQLEVQEEPSNGGLSGAPLAQHCLTLLKDMIHVRQSMLHNCTSADCYMCSLLTSWYQLAQELIAFFSPLHAAVVCECPEELETCVEMATAQSVQQQQPSPVEKVVHKPEEAGPTVHHPEQQQQAKQLGDVRTAKMETVSELDLAPILPSERVLRAVANAVTCTENEVANCKAQVSHPGMLSGDDPPSDHQDHQQLNQQYWVTTAGNFRFSLEELPNHLQLIYGFLKELYHLIRPDTQRHLLRCVEILCLHCEVLSKSACREHPGFLFWVQENLTVAQLWNLLESQTSHVAQTGASLLLHCLTLPGGSDVFWKIMESDFHSREWKTRFSSVERMMLVFQFLDDATVKQSSILQSILTNAFCFLISSMDDINSAVANRATILLESLHDGSLKLLCWCLEQQFDSFICDRPLLLHSIMALHHHPWLTKRKIISWKFFFNRFDSLYLEAQLSLQRAGELIEPRDLKASHMSNESFNKKLQKAREAIRRYAPSRPSSPTQQPRSLMRSLSLSNHRNFGRRKSAQNYQHHGGSKSYSRQGSSAQLKLLRSRGGLAGDRMNNQQASQEEAYVALFMQRCSELDDYDGETHSLLLTTLMQFLAQPDLAQLSDDKFQSQIQNLVLRHLSLLLGYGPTERAFCVTPQKLRSSATFNAFLSALPQVLDRNLAIGATLLPMTLSLMIFCPAPPSKANGPGGSSWLQCHGQAGVPIIMHGSMSSVGFASGSAAAAGSNNVNDRHNGSTPQRAYKPTYSLWYLETHPRRMWLQTVLVILYKYRYNQPNLAPLVQSIMRVVLNTLESQYHRCYRYGGIGATLSHGPPSTAQHQIHGVASAATMRMRDQSQASLEVDSPNDAADGKGRPNVIGHGVGAVLGIAGLVWGSSTIQHQIQFQVASNKANISLSSRRELTGSISSECDIDQDVDGVELEVIPESPKSSRPDPDWDRDSLAEVEILSEMSQQEPNAATAASEVSLATCVRQPSGVYEAHTVVSHRQINAADAAAAAAAATATPTGVRTRQRKIGISMGTMGSELPFVATEQSNRQQAPAEPQAPQPVPANITIPASIKQSSLRVGDEVACHRCSKCNAPFEEFSEEELGLCIVIISTFVHREPALAAPMLPEILRCNAKWAGSTTYTWQMGSNLYVPGEVGAIARQFLRCLLHQLTPNKVFIQLFQTQVPEQMKQSFFKTMASALTDFAELTPAAPLQLLLESLNEQKQLSPAQIAMILPNVACYFECLPPLELSAGIWTPLFTQLEIFCTRLILVLPLLNGNPAHSNSLLRIMASSNRVSALQLAPCRSSILEAFAKVVLYIVQHWAGFDYKHIVELCHLAFRSFVKDREKYMLTRTLVDELASVMKLKSSLPDSTLMILVHFILQDAGGTLPPHCLLMDDSDNSANHLKVSSADGSTGSGSTGAFDCIRPHFNDIMDFLADVHTLSKLKSNSRAMSPGPGLDEDTLGGTVKAGMAQLLALELVRGNGKDNKCLQRYMPWLLNPPSSIQQGPREFLECVCHVRLLSWLLLGALQHTALVTHTHSNGPLSMPTGVTLNPCLPLPIEVSCSLADHIQGILAGFAEQSKTSVLHMSSLYHAFLLCQLWTIYLEFMAGQQGNNSNAEQQATIFNVLVDFWSKITPSVLQLVAHSSVLTEMVNLHFLSLMEALAECRSSVLSLLLPLWTPVLQAQNSQTQLPVHLQVRLQACVEGYSMNMGTVSNGGGMCEGLETHLEGWLLRWLQKLQFKMGQIEIQSSTASQFYNV
ncbi:protein unc-79 homolog [Daphnia carinata]|uniref:protein unc-79 homolog n=1 Tax=Daphnia carinata TaxID=120202 RepID=UPI00257FAF0A|nr:protein unc-79 homolog [Daphnia carinata]